jgi:hypothetical protein
MSAVDLRDDLPFTLALIEDPELWRLRSVETFDFSLANHVRATTRYECCFPEDLAATFGLKAAATVRASIPLGARPVAEYDGCPVTLD